MLCESIRRGWRFGTGFAHTLIGGKISQTEFNYGNPIQTHAALDPCPACRARPGIGRGRQSFPEVVESLAGAEQAPEQNPGGGGDRQQPPPPQWSAPIDSEPAEDTTEEVSEAAPEKPASKSSDKPAPEEPPLGARLDVTG